MGARHAPRVVTEATARPYSRSAAVYDLLLASKDYRRASERLVRALRRHAPKARTLLDAGCGTGRHLEHLRHRYRVEGFDQSREMLDIAGVRCEGVPFHEASFEQVDLGRRFDVVTSLFGAMAYVRTRSRLREAARALARHLRPGGVIVVEPWVDAGRFIEGRTVFDYANTPDVKVARIYRTVRRGTTAVLDSHYVVGDANGVEHYRERQTLGLFTDRDYRTAFAGADLQVIATAPDLFGYGLYVCRARSGLSRTGTRRR